jgi:hypothetical protein
MDYSKVDGHSNLIRDESTKAIINTNLSEYQNYINLKKSKEKDILKIKNLESDVESMKNDLNEIKDLLRSLINGS